MASLNTDIFPQGLALGENFCNRDDERRHLKRNIESARPTLVMSPRRYGKTSLVLTVINTIKLPFAHIDLYAELNEVDIQNSVLSAIGDVLYSIESTPKKAFKLVTEFFSSLSVNFSYMGAEIHVELSRSRKAPAKVILDALKKLDETLKAKKKKVILFFDEFQRISQIAESDTIEGSIRHVAQQSKNSIFIFSGSNRHLLERMFSDRSRPLYKLCDRIMLERILPADYIPFIQKRSRQKWKKALPVAIIESILDMTERHPYYVNLLCHRACFLDKLPTDEDIDTLWHKYAMEEKTSILEEIDLLSGNQAKMLISIAKYGEQFSPMNKAFIAITKFSLSSASLAIKELIKKDYIFAKGDKYCLVDPLIKYVFFK